MRPTFIVAAASVAAMLTAAEPAKAQANRTFVSGQGSDSNPCSLSAPCRSFAQALTQTNAGGEITILDPAGYGTVTIGKSVSIVNDGVGEAGVTTTSAIAAITVTVGPNDVVNLRGLTLVGGGVGLNGISFNALGALNIQDCVIRGFTNAGLDFFPFGSGALNVSDTVISNTGTFAVDIAPVSSGTVTALFNRVQAIGASNGFVVDGGFSTGSLTATIANSTASNNQDGIVGESAASQSVTQLMVVNSVVSNNGIGVLEDGTNSTTFLAKTTLAGNATAFLFGSGGTLESFGDNYIKSNGSDGGAISLVQTK